MANLAKDPAAHYIARVNRAIDHVTHNLDASLALDDVARVACFSPHHFHRIFKTLTGETLATFVKRLRLERAVYLLSHRDGGRLTDIALACGFSSSADFSRSFRARYGVAPRDFDVQAFRGDRRDDMLAPLPAGENPDGFIVTRRDLPARTVAYIRVTRPYEEGRATGAVDRLLAWADARGLSDGQWLGYQWDDPEIVALDQCRYDVGVEVPRETPVGGEVGRVELPAMHVAEIDITGGIDLEQRAIDWLYRTWLPSSGFAPDHQPAFEAWNGRPFALGQTRFSLRVQLAIVPASAPI